MLDADSVAHILSRGVERRTIFMSDADYHFFLTQMKEVFDSHGVGILNFALMPNHFHIEPLTGNSPIGVPMQKLLTRFALYFNSKYERVGHLFQNRFKSFEVRDDSYLVQLPVYLTNNPVRARLVERPEQWEWSGHNEIVSGKQRILDLSRLGEVTGMSAEEWRESYLELVTRGNPIPPDRAALDSIIEFASFGAGISARDVLQGCKGKPFTRARRTFAREARRRNFTQSSIAEFLGISSASVSELLRD